MHEPTVPRATLVAIAQSYNQLHELNQRKAHTQAQLIRWCVQHIRNTDKPPSPYLGWAERKAAREKRAKEYTQALVYLEWLATQMEGHHAPEPTCQVT